MCFYLFCCYFVGWVGFCFLVEATFLLLFNKWFHLLPHLCFLPNSSQQAASLWPHQLIVTRAYVLCGINLGQRHRCPEPALQKVNTFSHTHCKSISTGNSRYHNCIQAFSRMSICSILTEIFYLYLQDIYTRKKNFRLSAF